MYLRRKIDRWLDDWSWQENIIPALVTGIRQCGKTESIRQFALRNKLKLVEMNFWTHPEYCSDFDGPLDVETLISNISLRFPNIVIDSSDTLIFFDEIQECPKARLALKSFANAGCYKVIGSGSYLGINGYIAGDGTPIPTGYEDIFDMKTMDFEEFLWANGYCDDQIDSLVACFKNKQPVPDGIHELFKSLFLKYACVGGFPSALKAYVETKNLMSSLRKTNSIVMEMRGDFGRRKDKNGNPFFKPSEVVRIQEAFDLIPTFLAKENKRFITSKIGGTSSAGKINAIEYLRQAHIVYKVHNLEVPSLPLLGSKIASQFKLFPADIGIVTSMYGNDTVIAMNQGRLGQAKGAIYESLVFDSLMKSGFDVFYFAKESGLEIDFVISYECEATLIEAKARTGNAKSSKTVMKHPEHYGKTRLIKIGDYNISQVGDVMTIPHYLTFALGRTRLDV